MKPESRFEFKYLLNPIQALKVRHTVSRLAKPDPHAGKDGWYTVTSLYYDTPALTDYYEKSGGYLERKKLRVRIYKPSLETDMPVWLELKKKYDMAFQKTRILLTPQDWGDFQERRFARLLSRERSLEDQATLEECAWYILREGRRPMFFVRYKRYPFLVEDHGNHPIRITLDEHIETRASTSLTAPAHPTRVREGMVLEVKFNDHMPPWFGALVRNLNLQRTTFSKYSRSIDMLNKFNPLPR